MAGASLVVLATASPALAQCSPDPAIGGTTICSGSDADGLTIAGTGGFVSVQPGASVRNAAGGPAVTSTGAYNTLSVAGAIDGGAAAGVSILNGPNQIGLLDLRVQAGGSIAGSIAVRIEAMAGFATGTIANEGTLTGTGGSAVATVGDGTLSGVFNTATGSVAGSIEGAISRVDNQGTITAGDRSAIALTPFGFYNILSVSNVGAQSTITNTSAATTITLAEGYVGNAGTIRNGGSGAAIAAAGFLSVTNGTTGVIASGGATAIESGGALTLVNEGSIIGSVLVAAGNSRIDNATGTIAGDVRLGTGDDLLRVAYADGRIANVTGVVDGGAGTDTIVYGIAADTTLGADALPTGFERLGVALSERATATLAADAGVEGGVLLEGGGTFVNLANLATTGNAIGYGLFGFNSVVVVNRATITAALGSPFETAVLAGGSIVNEGTIVADGGAGVSVSGFSPQAALTNNGTITATGFGAAVNYGGFVNSGTIRSSGDIGLLATFSFNGSTNSGTIEGATTGVLISGGPLRNSGTIRGGQTGIVAGNGPVDNEAGGVITGPVAITSYFSNALTIRNAGRIEGDVVNDQAFSDDLFVDAGGTVTGSIRLGDGNDTVVTALGGDPARPLAGAEGGVDAGGGSDLLVYRVATNATSAIPSPAAGFERLGYEVDGGATLTLTADAPVTQLAFAGSGTVDLNADLAAINATLLDLTISTTSERFGPNEAQGEMAALSLVSRGTIALTSRSDQFPFGGTSAVRADGARFENAGTIRVDADTPPFGITAAVSGGDIVNSGTIELSGTASGVGFGDTVVNSGSILGGAGSRATGVSFVGSLDNRGSIVVDGSAVQNVFGGAIDNSGLLESRTQAAVQLGEFGGSIVNRAGGVVRGPVAAITGSGAVVNEGRIVGNVGLGTSGFSFASSAYVAAGGTLEGDLVFGRGDDFLILRGPTLGITGRVRDLGGYDTYGVSLTASGAVAADEVERAGYEGRLIEAAGVDTVVTVTAASAIGDITLTGSGTIVNRADVAGIVNTGFFVPGGALTTNGVLAEFTNQATITGQVAGSVERFVNDGSIIGVEGFGLAVDLFGSTRTFTNTGLIREAAPGSDAISIFGSDSSDLAITNTGLIAGRVAIDSYAGDDEGGGAPVAARTIRFDNSGTIAAEATDGEADSTTGVVDLYLADAAVATTLTLNNSGSISASGAVGGALAITVGRGEGATMLALTNSGTIVSTATARTGFGASRLPTYAVDLLGSDDTIPSFPGVPAFTPGTIDAKLVNTASGTIAADVDGGIGIRAINVTLDLDNAGTIVGGSGGAIVSVGARDDIVRNGGRIVGSLDLGDGADRVENRGTIVGAVRLGAGDDAYLHLATATLDGIADGGDGSDVATIDTAAGDGIVTGERFVGFERLVQIGGGRVDYASSFAVPTIELAGGTLGVRAGATLATAGATAITGGDAGVTVDAAGTIAGDVRFGIGNDRFVERTGSMVAGTIDGGAGRDVYEAALSGDRAGLAARRGFEQLAVTGTGTLTLTADQAWDAIVLAGTGLDLRPAGFAIGSIAGSDAAEQVTLDDAVGAVALGGGADALTLTGLTGNGRYDGGAGADRLTIGAGAATVAGTISGFETIALAGNALTVTGTLGAAGETIGFGDGGQTVTVAASGTLLGRIELGAGDDRLVVAGGFVGAIDGGTGSDAIALSGGTAAAPIAVSTVSGVEAFAMTGGYATIAGSAGLGVATLSGGRLVGLAGSTIAATGIDVRQGATFGSAGTVNANLAVAGTLSPGASPGTMTVNGNVALATGSTTLFEITPTVSDKLLVSGSVAIASGATLQLAATESIRPGTSLDLIVADGGITGSFATVTKPATLFGFVTQEANRIRLLGQFLNDAGFPANARGAIDYVNATIAGGGAGAGFLAALPQLATTGGAADVAGFARITPEAYASARQIAVENGLLLADAARGPAFAAQRDTPGLFAFGQGLGSWRRIGGDAAAGVARVRADEWGALAGIGWAAGEWSVGAFGGYLDSRQTIGARGARTDADGAIGGVHARYAADRIALSATVAYAGGDARTRRAVPGGTALGRYDLDAWTGDLSASYRYALSPAWSVLPKLGATLVRATRGGVAESGGSAFALTVRRDRETAAFVDGGVAVDRRDAAMRVHAGLGARWQVAGRTSDALAALGGGGFGLVANGATRARVLGVGVLGVEGDVAAGVTLFASGTAARGTRDHQEAVRGGLRIGF